MLPREDHAHKQPFPDPNGHVSRTGNGGIHVADFAIAMTVDNLWNVTPKLILRPLGWKYSKQVQACSLKTSPISPLLKITHMKTVRLFTIGFALCSAAAPSLFGQNANFYCTNAVQMISGTNYTANTSSAPSDGGPAVDCTGNTIGHGVWYQITTPTNNVRLDISTCGSSYRTVLQVYTNACDLPGSPVQCARGGNPFGCSSSFAGLSFSAPSNTTYYIFVAGEFSDAGTLDIVANLVTPPPNDTCASPAILTNGVTAVLNTFAATEFGDPALDCTGNTIGHGVWYQITTPTNNVRLDISTCGSSYRTVLQVYTNACGASGSPVQCARGGNPFGCSK